MPNNQPDQISMMPLFDQAKILWFPVTKRRQVARGVARRLLAADSRREKVRLWKFEREKLAAEMSDLGLKENQIATELAMFFDLVGFEAWRISRASAVNTSTGFDR